MAEPLFSMTDTEIREAATRTATHVKFAYNDCQAELDRGSNRRLTLTFAVSTTVYAVLAALLIASRPSSRGGMGDSRSHR